MSRKSVHSYNMKKAAKRRLFSLFEPESHFAIAALQVCIKSKTTEAEAYTWSATVAVTATVATSVTAAAIWVTTAVAITTISIAVAVSGAVSISTAVTVSTNAPRTIVTSRIAVTSEPLRVYWRLFNLSYAAMRVSSSMA